MNTGKAQNEIALIAGLVLVALGLIFLFGQVFSVPLGHYLWPFFIIFPGLAFFAGMALGGKAAAPLAIPGSIITMTGVVLFFQNAFDLWASWAYAWALIFPTAVGLGLYILGQRIGDPNLRKVGARMAQVGVILFLVFGAFFEFIFFLSGARQGAAARLVWPVLLILLGLYLLFSRGAAFKARRETPPAVVDVAPSAELPGAGCDGSFAAVSLTLPDWKV